MGRPYQESGARPDPAGEQRTPDRAGGPPPPQPLPDVQPDLADRAPSPSRGPALADRPAAITVKGLIARLRGEGKLASAPPVDPANAPQDRPSEAAATPTSAEGAPSSVQDAQVQPAVISPDRGPAPLWAMVPLPSETDPQRRGADPAPISDSPLDKAVPVPLGDTPNLPLWTHIPLTFAGTDDNSERAPVETRPTDTPHGWPDAAPLTTSKPAPSLPTDTVPATDTDTTPTAPGGTQTPPMALWSAVVPITFGDGNPPDDNRREVTEIPSKNTPAPAMVIEGRREIAVLSPQQAAVQGTPLIGEYHRNPGIGRLLEMWPFDPGPDLEQHVLNGGSFAPDVHYSGHRTLEPDLGPGESFTIITDTDVTMNAMTAHGLGAYLEREEKRLAYLEAAGTPGTFRRAVVIDTDQGRSILRGIFETAAHEYPIKVAKPDLDRMLAEKGPERAARILALDTVMHSQPDAPDIEAVSNEVLPVFRVLINTIRETDPNVYVPSIELLHAGVTAMLGDKVKQLLIANGGPLTQPVLDALRVAWPPEKITDEKVALRKVERRLELLLLQAEQTGGTVPLVEKATIPDMDSTVHQMATGEPPEKEEEPEINVIVIPNTGATPSKDLLDFMVAYLYTDALDLDAGVVGFFGWNGLRHLKPGQIDLLKEALRRRGAQLMMTGTSSTPTELLAHCPGKAVFGSMDVGGVSEKAAFYGNYNKKEILKTVGADSSSTDGYSIDRSRTTGSSDTEKDESLLGKTHSTNTSSTVSRSENHSTTSGVHASVAETIINEQIVPTQVLHDLGVDQVIVVDGSGTSRRHDIHPYDYPQLPTNQDRDALEP